jgi:GUN4-like/TIR domain
MIGPAGERDDFSLPDGLEQLLSEGREALASELSTGLDIEAGLTAIAGTRPDARDVPSRGNGVGAGPHAATRRAFVVCHAAGDDAYSRQLIGQLQEAGLPTWSVSDLRPGEDWRMKVRQQIADAIAILVLMSPRSQDSDGITRMILEGQSHGGPFLPLLLRGQVNYLLASTRYFDARSGELPDDGLLDALRILYEADAAGGPADPATMLPPSLAPSVTLAVGGLPPDGLDQIDQFLGEQEFLYADLQTTALVLNSAGRSAEGWLREPDARAVPLDLITGIDALWSRHSGGRQGFRAQMARAQPLRGRPGEFARLSIACGWQDARGASAHWDYEEFSKRADGDKRPAFFPTLRTPQGGHRDWYERWQRTVLSVHRRLQE